MLVKNLKLLFTRDLKRLQREIELYENEDNLWKTDGEITNSAGNLCLHLIGNLNTYIGKEIGKSAYVRNRELEFSLKNIPRAQLIDDINNLITIMDKSLDTVDETSLAEQYPILVFDEMTSTEYLLVHLTTHLTYHLGQINYHRRLLDGRVTIPNKALVP